MKNHFVLVGLLVCILLFLTSAPLEAQNFVYTNNDIGGPNTVTAFLVGANGALTQIPGSPFSTGGNGSGGGLFASNRAIVTRAGNFLYVSNCGDASITGFSINPSTGKLTLIPGSPFSSGDPAFSGMGLAVTSDSHFLYAANSNSDSIYGFSIAGNGALALLPGFPIFAGGDLPDGMKISPNNKFLAVALIYTYAVAMFAINPDGSLTTVPGSPFPSGEIAGLDFNCTGTLLFGGEVSANTTIDVYNVAANGVLSPIPGSPFTFYSGTSNSNVVIFDPVGNFLFVSNQDSQTVGSFSVAANGSLTPTSGFPTPVSGEVTFPTGMALTQSGKFLYVANFSNVVAAFSVGSNGALTAVPGTPFSTGQSGGLLSLAVYPPIGCFDSCIRDHTSGTFLLYNSTSGSYSFTSCPTGASLLGTGRVTSFSCGTMLSDSSSGGRVTGTTDRCHNQVTAWVYLYSPWFRGFAMMNTLAGSPLSACACP